MASAVVGAGQVFDFGSVTVARSTLAARGPLMSLGWLVGVFTASSAATKLGAVSA